MEVFSGANDPRSDLVLVAPIVGTERFVEFRIQYKTRSIDAESSPHGCQSSSWSLVRTVVDRVEPEQAKYLVSIPVGAQYQERAPAFLRNLTIIDSRAPGTGSFKHEQGDVYFDLLSPLLQELGVGHVYVATSSSTSIAENAASFSSSGTVVVLGGDTSVHEFINALKPGNVPGANEIRLALVPTGTGNALANSIGLTSPLEAVRRLFLAKSCDFVPLSTVRVDFPAPVPSLHALVVASWGFHSALVADSDSPEIRAQYRADPSDRFRAVAKQHIESVLQDYEGTVSTLPASNSHHSYLLFTLVTHLEHNFLISPHSAPPSSLELYMVYISAFRSLEEQHALMGIMREAYNGGKHIEDGRVTYKKLPTEPIIVKVNDQPERMRRWCIDGVTVVSPPGLVQINVPTHLCNNWALKILPNVDLQSRA